MGRQNSWGCCGFCVAFRTQRRIVHRLFTVITQKWRDKPLVSHRAIIQLIAKTHTDTVPTVACRIDANAYENEFKISNIEMGPLNLQTDDFHGK